MATFQIAGLPAETFAALDHLSDEELSAKGVIRVVADEKPGYPCRISLVDAEVGEELYLLPFSHQSVDSPYRASGPILIRSTAQQRKLPAGEIPDCVRFRLMSLRAYDARHMMVDALVCDGPEVAEELERQFSNKNVIYVHLHNAKRGCFSCLVQRSLGASSDL